MYTSISRIARIEQMNAERCRSLPTEADTSLLLRISVSARLYFSSILSITAARCSESIEVERISTSSLPSPEEVTEDASTPVASLNRSLTSVWISCVTAVCMLNSISVPPAKSMLRLNRFLPNGSRISATRPVTISTTEIPLKILKFLRIGKCFFSSLRSRRP